MVSEKHEYWQKTLQYDLGPEMLAGDAQTVGQYGFPQLSEQKFIPSGKIIPFNYLKSSDDLSSVWVHCFVYDSQFQRLWNSFDKYVPLLLSVRGLISTDFSLYRDFDEELLIWNCRRNRVIAYAAQKAGVNVIPTAGFGGENTWKWCFDGLPHHSTVAITTNGTLSDPEARRLFVGGVEALVYTVEPYAIIVCGPYPGWLDTKYPSIRIIHIPSYSQQWKVRCR